MSNLRYRIGLLPQISAEPMKHLHKSALVVCSKDPKMSKYGLSKTVAIQDEIGVHWIARISANIVYCNDEKKIVAYIKEHKPAFCVVITPAKVSEESKALIEKSCANSAIHFVDIGSKPCAVDVGLGRWVRVVNDLQQPLYEASFKKVKAKKSSSPAPSKDSKGPKVKAVESASPNPPKAEKQKKQDKPSK